MRYAREPRLGDPSPWGIIEYQRVLIPGRAVMVETPSHGGVWIEWTHWLAFEQSHPDLIAFALKWSHGWRGYFEEDCAVTRLVAAWPSLADRMREQGYCITTGPDWSPTFPSTEGTA